MEPALGTFISSCSVRVPRPQGSVLCGNLQQGFTEFPSPSPAPELGSPPGAEWAARRDSRDTTGASRRQRILQWFWLETIQFRFQSQSQSQSQQKETQDSHSPAANAALS